MIREEGKSIMKVKKQEKNERKAREVVRRKYTSGEKQQGQMVVGESKQEKMNK